MRRRVGLALCSLALSGLALSSCAVHAPMSEAVLFRDGPAHHGPTRLVVGLSGSQGVLPRDALNREANARFGNPDLAINDVEGLNPSQLGAGGYAIVQAPGARSAVSVSLGPGVAGLDGTARVADNLFVTASGSLLGGAALLVQRRAVETRALQAAVGAGYQLYTPMYSADVRGADEPAPSGPFPTSLQTLRVHSVGVRARVIGRAETQSGIGFSALAFLGYTPTVRSPLATVGIAFGRH